MRQFLIIIMLIAFSDAEAKTSERVAVNEIIVRYKQQINNSDMTAIDKNLASMEQIINSKELDIHTKNSTIKLQSQVIDDLQKKIDKYVNKLEQFYLVDFKFKIVGDHEKFVLGGPFKLNMEIINNSDDLDVEIDTSEIQLVIPKEVIANRNKNIAFAPDNSEGKIILVPKSSYTVVWDKSFVEAGKFISFRDKIFFRSDLYRFVVNLKMKKAGNSNDYTSTTNNTQSAAGGTNDTSNINLNNGNKFYVTREVRIQVDLDNIYISFSAIIGAIMAVIAWYFISNITLHREYYYEFKSVVRRIEERNQKELVSFFILTFFVPPIVLAMTAYGVRMGVQIRVMDFIGAVITGFGVQLLLISFGHRYMYNFTRDW